MKYLAAIALSAALAQPVSATTFPTLTTIYVASGVFDDGAADNAGTATSVHCSNVSGQNATVRFLVLNQFGVAAGSHTLVVPHGETVTLSTHLTSFGDASLATGAVVQGVLNVEATQSAVFCSAMIVPAGSVGFGVALHLVRVNPHPALAQPVSATTFPRRKEQWRPNTSAASRTTVVQNTPDCVASMFRTPWLTTPVRRSTSSERLVV